MTKFFVILCENENGKIEKTNYFRFELPALSMLEVRQRREPKLKWTMIEEWL